MDKMADKLLLALSCLLVVTLVRADQEVQQIEDDGRPTAAGSNFILDSESGETTTTSSFTSYINDSDDLRPHHEHVSESSGISDVIIVGGKRIPIDDGTNQTGPATSRYPQERPVETQFWAYQQEYFRGLKWGTILHDGECENVPFKFGDRVRSLEVLYNVCVRLYQDTGCNGPYFDYKHKDFTYVSSFPVLQDDGNGRSGSPVVRSASTCDNPDSGQSTGQEGDTRIGLPAPKPLRTVVPEVKPFLDIIGYEIHGRRGGRWTAKIQPGACEAVPRTTRRRKF